MHGPDSQFTSDSDPSKRRRDERSPRRFIWAAVAGAAGLTAPNCHVAKRNFVVAFIPGSTGIKADRAD